MHIVCKLYELTFMLGCGRDGGGTTAGRDSFRARGRCSSINRNPWTSCGDRNRYFKPKHDIPDPNQVLKPNQTVCTALSQHTFENWTQQSTKLQHNECEVSAYGWFTDTHIDNIYFSHWVVKEVVCFISVGRELGEFENLVGSPSISGWNSKARESHPPSPAETIEEPINLKYFMIKAVLSLKSVEIQRWQPLHR